MNRFGEWTESHGLPCFAYLADDPDQHWSVVGNRAIRLWCATDGTVALWEESDALRWLTAPDPEGTGVSMVRVDAGEPWGSAFAERPADAVPVRTFGPTWFAVSVDGHGVRLERTVLCPEGEIPWVLVRVVLRSTDGRPHDVEHSETWRVRPRHPALGLDAAARRRFAEAVVAYDAVPSLAAVRAVERRSSSAPDVADAELLHRVMAAFGAESGAEAGRAGDGSEALLRRAEPAGLLSAMGTPRTLILESWGSPPARPTDDGCAHPTLTLETSVRVEPGRDTVLWCRFGRDDGPVSGTPGELFETSMAALSTRLPRAGDGSPAAREVPWHAALLTGAAARDEVFGGHTLNQGSAYAFELGLDAATRDVLQHALPLVYIEPDLALSVLRHCLARADAAGDLPYALDAGKRPVLELFQPSDQNLYALWLAAEYLAATGDTQAFAEPLTVRGNLTEHLIRQFRFFVDVVGRGERGHVRLCNADWNDGVIGATGAPRPLAISRGESVLNSAFAAWVLPVWAAAAERLGRPDVAAEARVLADELRGAVQASWNGRWFHRAYVPGGAPVGEDECWLEPQPWAILCGAADDAQTKQLLDTIDELGRSGSPLGCRVRFGEHGGPVPEAWYAVNGSLIWAAANAGASWAWDEWHRMSLAQHSSHYPDIWEGVLSGPDAWLTPESPRPGHTWSAPEAGISMQSFPVANGHAHAQPLFAYLRLLGVEPTADGGLRAGTGGAFRSATFSLDLDGHGSLRAAGDVTVHHAHDTTTGTGTVTW